MTAAAAPHAGLALYANCAELVIAFDIDDVMRVALADGRPPSSSAGATGLSTFSLDGEHLPAWDLGTLLGLRKPTSAQMWIVIKTMIDGRRRRFALSCDHSIAVRPQPRSMPLPPRLFASRQGAVTGAFVTKEISDDRELAPTGFLLSAAHLLSSDDRHAASQAAEQGRLTW